MRVTIKLTYRSKRKAIDKKISDSVLCSPFASSPRLAADQIESRALVPRNDQREIVLGAIPMNYLDPSKKLAGHTSEPLLTRRGAASEEIPKPSQLHWIPTEEVQVAPSSRIVLHTDPSSPGADRFRFLRMCLRDLWDAGKLKSLLITSPLPQDGKSTIALNLATALADGGKRTVLLIEADLHHPTLVGQLNLQPRPGLAECLERGLNPLPLVRRLEPLNWYLLSAGEATDNPTELLQTEALAGVMRQLSPHFDWILIDSPPVSPLTDAVSLARHANATLLIARKGRTPRESIEKAITLVGRQRVLGIVLNAVEGLDRLYSGYYGHPKNNRLAVRGRPQEWK
jgi:capsular exopolysaccharide synthesis family protein